MGLFTSAQGRIQKEIEKLPVQPNGHMYALLSPSAIEDLSDMLKGIQDKGFSIHNVLPVAGPEGRTLAYTVLCK